MVIVDSIKEYEVTGNLVLDERARGKWCKLPYGIRRDAKGEILKDKSGNIKYYYPLGCPNYGVNKTCPPYSSSIESFIDINKKHWFIVAKFDLKKQAERMKASNPDWSDKQCRNSRLWHNSVKKLLREDISLFKYKIGKFYVFTLKPEAMGIHVFKTAKNLGIPIKAKLKDTVYKIGLVGYSRNSPQTLDALMS